VAEPVAASPFTHLTPDRSGGGAGALTLAECRGRALLTIAGPVASDGFVGAVRAVLGAELPREPGGVAAARDGWTVWTGPAEWLYVTPGGDGWALERELARAVVPAGGTVVDVSHGRAVLRLTGAPVRALLSEFCAIDLHERGFPAGRCTQTLFGKMTVLLHALADDQAGGDGFEVYVSRSYADALAEAIRDAAREFGCHVGNPVA
jgi:sarcosine oxidase subunit gamma